MKNYFHNAKVKWNLWSPERVFFKSNNITKNLLPQENLISYKSKGDRDAQMSKITGGQAVQGYQGHTYHSQENYKAVMVQLADVKGEFPTANVDFIDCSVRKDSVGNRVGNINVLVYINSYHSEWNWHQGQNGHYTKTRKSNVTPVEEGYRICYGGQGDANSLNHTEFSEILDVSESVRRFLVDCVIPYKNGECLDLVA